MPGPQAVQNLQMQMQMLFDKIKPCIKQGEGTCLFLRATCQSYIIICSYFNEDGVDYIQLAIEVLESKPYRFKL